MKRVQKVCWKETWVERKRDTENDKEAKVSVEEVKGR